MMSRSRQMVTVLRLEGAEVNGDEEEVVLETNMIDDGTEEFDQAILAVDTRKVLETLQDEDKARRPSHLKVQMAPEHLQIRLEAALDATSFRDPAACLGRQVYPRRDPRRVALRGRGPRGRWRSGGSELEHEPWV